MKLLPALALATLAAALLAAPAAAREVRAAGPVSALGVGGAELGFAASYRAGCHEVRVWDTRDRGVRGYASHCFAPTSTGSGVAAVSVAGGRALWVSYTGGNIREWSLWTKSRTSRARRIDFQARDVDGRGPFVLGAVWRDSLPYATDATIVVLRRDGGRRFTLRAPSRVTALAEHVRGYAAVLENGTVLTVSSDGRPLREHAFAEAVHAAVLAGPGLVAKTASGLEIRNGDAVRKLPLPAGARFLGLSDGLVAYASGAQLRLLRLRDGRDVLLRTLTPGFLAQLGPRGLGFASGRRVGYMTPAAVAAAMGG
ncbi:MAG TPA: hypothetical protein VNT23_04410 [Gaiellaceae bacterium]|nr:hypothetical protein [Gaiellaceae bacterium]